MSDVFTKRRPMIDLDEFESRLCPPCSTDRKDGYLLTELLRIIGDNDEPHKTDFELSAGARQGAGEPDEWKQLDAQVRLVGGDFAEAEMSTVEYKRPNARVPLISGDFAAIEAGLLGAMRDQAAATVSETDKLNAFPSVGLGSEHRVYRDNHSASRHGGVADGQKRSRRPLYFKVAIVVVGMAGIAVSFGLNSRLSDPTEIASIKADNGPDKQQTKATSNADGPTQDAAILSKPPETLPTALVNGTERTNDLPPAKEKTLPAKSPAQLDNGPAAVREAPTPTEALSTVVSAEPDPMKTDLVRPDGALLPNGTPPQSNINGAPLPAPQSPAATKAPTAKVAGRVAKPLKPAMAKHPGSHGQPRQIANKAKATPMSPLTSEPAPIANPKAETSMTQPSPLTNGAFGFVQSGVNSLTSTTAKLFEWGTN